MAIQLITEQQIADKLSMDCKLFRRVIKTHPTFPRPTLCISQKTIRWDEADIDKWLAQKKQEMNR